MLGANPLYYTVVATIFHKLALATTPCNDYLKDAAKSSKFLDYWQNFVAKAFILCIFS